jgi:hypothetical protein
VSFLYAFAVFLAVVGAGCVLSGFFAELRRIDLAERLMPFRSTSVADEAEEWLNSRA